MTLTDQQLEAASREYCRLIGRDPEGKTSGHPEWQHYIYGLRSHHQLTEALRLATAEPAKDHSEAREVAAKLRAYNKARCNPESEWRTFDEVTHTIDRAAELLEGRG